MTPWSFTLLTLQWLWALPLTLCALPLWCAVWCAARAVQWRSNRLVPYQAVPKPFYKPNHAVVQVFTTPAAIVFVAYSPAIAWLLRHHPFGEMQAVAVGCCVLAQDAQMLERTLPHELVHVQQALHWGPLFPLAYAACSVWAYATGRCVYADNYFEKQAQRCDV
jgi:hypothetical protein